MLNSIIYNGHQMKVTLSIVHRSKRQNAVHAAVDGSECNGPRIY